MSATLTATAESISRIPVPAAEVAWNTLGANLATLQVDLIAIRDAAAIDCADTEAAKHAAAIKRDAAGFAAMGVASAIESFGLITSLRGAGSDTAWTDLVRILAADISGGINPSVRDGLAKAIDLINAAQATFRVTYNR